MKCYKQCSKTNKVSMKTKINFGYLIFLSVVAALGGFLFGYDTAVISGTIAQVTHLFQLDSLQQGWYVGCALVGSIVGVLMAGILSDMTGRKRTMIFSAILFSASFHKRKPFFGQHTQCSIRKVGHSVGISSDFSRTSLYLKKSGISSLSSAPFILKIPLKHGIAYPHRDTPRSKIASRFRS